MIQYDSGEPVSGFCSDGDHDACLWPHPPDNIRDSYCSCPCHLETHAMTIQSDQNTQERISGQCYRDAHGSACTSDWCECDCHKSSQDLDADLRRVAATAVGSVEAAQAQEREATPGHYITASLCGKPVRIVPSGAWRVSWQRKLKEGDFDAFLDLALHPEDVDLYEELDPTLDELGQFISDASELSGESLGKSNGPRGSSKSMRRR